MIQVTNESKRTPSEVVLLVTRTGGRNVYGKPNYRVVWGYNRLTWIGGKWTDRDEQGGIVREVVEVREVQKYPQTNRWLIERWFPAGHYGTPQQWAEQAVEVDGGVTIQAAGPYPAEGEYELVQVIEDEKGEYLDLTPEVCEIVVQVVEGKRARSFGEILRTLRAEKEAERKALRDRDADKFLDRGLPFYGRSNVSVL